MVELEYYLDGHTIFEIDVDSERYREVPVDGRVDPEGEVFELFELSVGEWEEVDSYVLEGIRANGVELVVVEKGGDEYLYRRDDVESALDE